MELIWEKSGNSAKTEGTMYDDPPMAGSGVNIQRDAQVREMSKR
jgi:hypothetical protein